jgi:TonB-linked SusC/RagA family outer membrane protein
MRKYLPFTKLLVCLFGSQLLVAISGYSQDVYAYSSNHTQKLNPQQQKDTEKQTLFNVLKDLNKTKGVYFLFSEKDMAGIQVNPVKDKQVPVEKILEDVLRNTGLKYKKVSDNTFVILKEKEKVKTGSLYAEPDFGDDNENTQTVDQSESVFFEIITGKVTAGDGNPLPGVSVVVKGTKKGTTTNSRGDFSIDVKRGDVLIFSYIGYEPQEITVGQDNSINVSLVTINAPMTEVVVSALGIRKEVRRLGYAVTKVNGEEFTKSREINVGNALAGKVAGVNSSGPLTGPGGSSRVIIRGINSLTGDNQPLYVVNGVPLNNSNFGSAGMWGGADLGEGLTSLNPDDIEEITVLKGGAAAALYGQLAKNGVIMITTKSGKGKKGLGIELNSNLQIDKIHNFLDFQNVYGQGTLGAKPIDATSALNTGMSAWGAPLDGSNVPIFNGQPKPYSDQGDNLNRFYKTGTTFTNTLAMTGGSDAGNYRLSFGDLRNNSIYPDSRYIRNTVNLDLNYKLSSKWSGQANILYAKEIGKNRTNLSDGPGNGNYGILFLPPNVNADYLKPGYDANGNEIQFSGDAFTTNPYFAAAKFRNDTKKDRVFTVASLRYSPLDWLYIQARVGNDNYAFNAVQITPTGTAYRPAGSLDNDISWFYNQINSDVLVGLKRNITHDIAVNVTGGANLLQERQKINTINASGLAFPYLYNPGAASTRGANTSTPRKDVRSVYGSAEFSYKNNFFLNVTDRNDWSSTIPVKNNSYNYPSVNASYVFSENVKQPWLDFGKLRVGYSQIGADASPFQTALYYNTNGAINGQPIGNLGSTIPNNQLEPLQIKEFEVGTQLSLFKNRLNLDFAWYDKKTLNDIVQGSVSIGSGYSAAVVNVGKVENKGIEISLGGTPVKTANFLWTTSVNFSHNANEVVELAEGQAFMDLSESRTTRGFIQHRIGMPAYQVMVFDYKKDSKGVLIVNASGFPQGADALSPAGTSIPPNVGGWNNQLTYKNFGLDFLIDFKSGAMIYSGTNARAYAAGLQKETLNGRSSGISVTGVNGSGNPVTTNVSAQNYYGALSGISIVQTYKADFIKFRSLALTYNFPQSFLKNKIQGMSLSLVGRNLFYIKKNTPNIDPEANYSNNFSLGLEYASLPSTSTLGVNLNVKF